MGCELAALAPRLRLARRPGIELFFKLFLGGAVFKLAKQLGLKNGSALNLSIDGTYKLFRKLFRGVSSSCFVCPPPYRGHNAKHLRTGRLERRRKAL